MHTKTMEGLIGARTNMNLVNTPMRVYKEARRKGNLEVMERAMGYVGEFSDKAEEYKAEADKGMKEEGREAREKEKLEQEEAIRKRREEREKQEEKLEKEINGDTVTDTVEISEEGKVLLKGNEALESTGADGLKAAAVKDPVIYTGTGKSVPAEQAVNISVSV